MHSAHFHLGEITMKKDFLNFIGPIWLCLFLAAFSAGSIYGWNKPGHMTTAAIAYQELKLKDETALKEVIKLLKKHSHYGKWKERINQLNLQEEEDLFLFMYAARWADDVRSDENEHRESWHYINYPFKPADEPDWVVPFAPQNENIETAWAENAEKLTDTTNSEKDRARALVWMFHLEGDAHQPLHTVSLFNVQTLNNTSAKRKKGDRGGTWFYIKVTNESSSTISLHTFWDNAVIGSDRFQSVRNEATGLRSNYPRSGFGNLNEPDFRQWIQESFSLAKEKAYLNGTLQGSKNKNNGAVLPGDYAEQVKPVAEQRVALAGYRFADYLSRIF